MAVYFGLLKMYLFDNDMHASFTDSEADNSNQEFLKNQKNIMENEKADLIATDFVMDNKMVEDDTKDVAQNVENVGRVSDPDSVLQGTDHERNDKTTLSSDNVDPGAGGDTGSNTGGNLATPVTEGSGDHNQGEDIHTQDKDKDATVGSMDSPSKPQDEWMDVLGNGKLKKKVSISTTP